MLRQATYFLASTLILMAIFIASERIFSPSFQSCVNPQPNFKTQTASDNKPSRLSVPYSYIFCSGEFVDGHSPGITALATIIIAAFTCTLWAATSRQAELTERSVKVAEDALVKVERPRIVTFAHAFTIVDAKITAQIGLVNFGRSPGIYKRMEVKFIAGKLPKVPDFKDAKIDDPDMWILPTALYDTPRSGIIYRTFTHTEPAEFISIRTFYEWELGKHEQAFACTIVQFGQGKSPETVGGAAYNYEK
jgi:hypothetical protein